MSEQGGKKNSTMIALAVVLAVAVILSLVLFNQRNSLSAQVDTLTEELTESRETWENTAAEKEEIEAELKDVQDALREAETALEESTTKIGSLQSELEEAQRVRTEAQNTLDTLSGQIDSLTQTLDYARSVLAGTTEEPAAEEETPAPVEPEETEPAETAEPEATEEPMPLIAPIEEAIYTAEPEATEEPTEEPEVEETEAPAEDEATVTDIHEIPGNAVKMEVALDEETVLTLYVLIDDEDEEIVFVYGEGLDVAFLEQLIGRQLPVLLASEEEPEGIELFDTDEETAMAVIDAINSLLPAEEAVVEEVGEETAI